MVNSFDHVKSVHIAKQNKLKKKKKKPSDGENSFIDYENLNIKLLEHFSILKSSKCVLKTSKGHVNW